MSEVVVLGRHGDSISWDPAAIFNRASREQPQIRKPQNGNMWLSAQDVAQLIVAGEYLDAGVPPPARFAPPALASAVNSVYRWANEGRIFAVHELYARYQFDERGRPHAVVEQVMRRLGPTDVLRVGNWLSTPNPHLEGRRPQDLLASASAEVLRALQLA